MGPLLRDHPARRRQDGELRIARSLRDAVRARRARRRYQERSPGRPRPLRRLSNAGRAGQGGDHARSPLGRPLRDRPGRRLARVGVARLRLSVPADRHPTRHARRSDADHPRPAHPGAHDVSRQALLGRERVVPAAAGAEAAADLDRRPRREAHAAARGPLRRRLERGLRLAAAVQAPVHDARPVVREGRARPGVDRAQRQRRVQRCAGPGERAATAARARAAVGLRAGARRGRRPRRHAGHRGGARRRVRRGRCRRRQRSAARALEQRSARRLRRDHVTGAATRVRRRRVASA